MIGILKARWHQKHRTTPFPSGPPPALPQLFRGLPVLSPEKCGTDCRECVAVCPTSAIVREPALGLDLGRCLFCTACETACPTGALQFGRDYRLSVRERGDLFLKNGLFTPAVPLEGALLKVLGRALKLRQVSAGGCNACEADTNVLNTVGWDLGRFGIQFVASPRHADGILVTGPVPENMRLGLLKTWAAVPEPKIAIAVGACAISGGPFAGHREVHDGAQGSIPIDLFIPGCPPHPLTILDGLLRLVGKLRDQQR